MASTVGGTPNEVEEVMKGLLSQPGVAAYIVINSDGIPIKRYAMDYPKAVHYSALLLDLVAKSRSFMTRLLEPGSNEVQNIRLRTLEHEVIVAPGRGFILIVLQLPMAEDGEGGEEEEESKS
eukprot:PLAT12209.1.p2 GENE.PLAT12209.1~~PLAT12209.1.p2  ORF type:complete len:137 (-),score=58.88 PLAT12209.1:166-531(-)